MAKRNMQMRGLTDYEKYMVALARQRRQDAASKADVIPFPKKKFNSGGLTTIML